MGRKRNTEAIVQILILFAIICLLLYVMISKKVNYYVHPRFYIGIWISIIILFLFGLALLSKIKKARHNANVRHYIIFLIPILASVLFPCAGVNGKDMTLMNHNQSTINKQDTTKSQTNKDVARESVASENLMGENLVDKNESNEKVTNENVANEANENVSDYSNDYSDNRQNEEEIANNVDKIEDRETTNSQDTLEVYTTENKDNVLEKYKEYEKDGIMVITDDIFAEWYDDVYENLDAFKGKKCRYLAQVYSMDDIEKNQFLAGRYFMVCCAADLVGYGILCESDNRSELQDEEWITVEGTIGEYEYNGYMVPLITDATIIKAEEPDVVYIYYNYF